MSEDLNSYFLSYFNVNRILQNRGYDIPIDITEDKSDYLDRYAELYEDYTIEEIKKEFSYINYVDEDSSSNNTLSDILVKWHVDKKLGANITNIIDEMEREGIKKAFIISDCGITASCREILKNLKITKKIIIEVWTLKETMIYILDHVYVPKHRICTLNEKKQLFAAYAIDKKKLPRIAHDDIVVRYLDANKNQLIEITRKSDTNPDVNIITYRIVC